MTPTPRIFGALSLLAVLAALAHGCKSAYETTSETARTERSSAEPGLGDVDSELYWYQRGTDATKAVWEKYRQRGESSLLRSSKGTGSLDFWFSAQAFDLLLDSVGMFWRKDLAAEAVETYFKDFAAEHPDRAAHVFNDDVLWWAIACTRAARITNESRYLVEAKDIYDRLWTTQVDNALGGGMWWRADEHKSKSACVNFPAVIVAMNLYQATKDVKYLLQGRRIYQWAVEHLFDKETGKVNDHETTEGAKDERDFSYNYGTFIGASLRLYRATGSKTYLSNAAKAADYLVGNMSQHGIMKCAGQGDGGAFNGIAVRYLAELARRPGGAAYRKYLLANANSAWTSRRLSDGVNGPDWSRAPQTGEVVEPQTAVSAAMLYFATSRAFR
jgi:predicted alpha-1,6-mannanase (GH76 family)